MRHGRRSSASRQQTDGANVRVIPVNDEGELLIDEYVHFPAPST